MPTTTWERLPEARRNAVISAAEDEFSRHGFSGGSLFQYFRDKSDLYAYLSERASVRIREDMEVAIRSLDWSQGFFVPLRELVVLWEEYFHSHPWSSP